MVAVQDHPGSTLSPVELHLRLVEVEVEVERLQQVLLLELEEVPQLQAQLLSPLHVCTGLLLASVYTSSQLFGGAKWGRDKRGHEEVQFYMQNAEIAWQLMKNCEIAMQLRN